MELDPAVLELLHLDPAQTTVTPVGRGCSSAITAMIAAKQADGLEKHFFLKTMAAPEGLVMVRGIVFSSHEGGCVYQDLLLR
jgi:protein-ribulosamine 3-kinase